MSPSLLIPPAITAILLAGALFQGSSRSFQTLVLAAMLAALWGSGSRLARWLVPDFETESRWTAAFTFAVAVAVVPATWMGHFGWMWPRTFLVWTALAYVASRFLPQPAGPGEEARRTAPGAPIPWLQRFVRIETPLLVSAILAVAYVTFRDMRRLRYAAAGSYGFDDISYHLAAVAVWLRHGDLRMIRFSMGDASTPFYPVLGEVSSWVLFTPFVDSDVAARWTQLPFGIFSCVAVAAIARRLGLSRWHGVFAALMFGSIHRVLPVFALGAGNDHSLSFFTLAAIDAGLALARRPRPGAAVATGAALGLLLGTKYIGVLFAPVLVAVIAAAHLLERRGEGERASGRALARLAVVVALAAVVTGGYTYLRNAVTMGNPIFPAPLRVLGVEVFPGWEATSISHRKDAPEFDIDVWHFLTGRKELFGPFFPFTMLPAALLAPLLALARRRFVTALVLCLPAVFFLQFLYLMHDHRDMRYFLPGVGLAAVAFSWLLAQASPWAAPLRAGLLALITYQATRRLGRSDLSEVLLTLAALGLGAMAVAGWRRGWGASWRPGLRRWGGLAAAVGIGVAALMLGPSVEKYQRVKLDRQPGPLALERLVGPRGARVGYAGLNQPYLFFGSRMQNDLQIVPRSRRGLPGQYYSWRGPVAEPYEERGYGRWRSVLDRLKVEYLVIIPTEVPTPERRWVAKRPEEFELLFDDGSTEIWRVLPGRPEPAGPAGADRPERRRRGPGTAPRPARGSGSRSS
jgi:Dolichyl-phosphate-mannose-protein mannosyltransferase